MKYLLPTIPYPSAHRTQRGFTLIEMLVSIALVSIMTGVALSLYAIVNNTFTQTNELTRIQSQGSSVMEYIQRTARSATSLSYTFPDGRSCPDSSPNCIVFIVPPESIEYQSNGGCPVVVYYFRPADSNHNGRLTKMQETNSGDQCGGNATDLFDSSRTKGMSVALRPTTSNVFTISTGQAGAANLLVEFNLTSAEDLTNKVSVPFVTRIALRNYAR